MDLNETYRFTPSNGASLFKKAELILQGAVVAVSDTTAGSDGLLDLNFKNTCLQKDSATYVIRVTYGSCSNAATEIIFEDSVVLKRDIPHFELVTQNATCIKGGTISITAPENVANYTYSINGGVFQSSNNFSNLTTGDYTITATSGSCSIIKKATILLENNLFVQTVKDTAICYGTSFQATTNSNAATLSWQPTLGLSNPAEESPVINAPSTITYIVTATEGSCNVRDTLEVKVKAVPQVNAGEDQTIIEGETAQLKATASAGRYLWTPAISLSASEITNPIAKPAATTTYLFSATNVEGCTVTDAVTVNVLPYCFKPMEAFTPNGDGVNDLWLLSTGNCLNTAKVQVLNRYGHVVFESSNYKNNWNGTYGGKPLPDGTYYFIISYQWTNGKTIFKKGNVTILR
jgi:gliding motility-associated-like protein